MLLLLINSKLCCFQKQRLLLTALLTALPFSSLLISNNIYFQYFNGWKPFIWWSQILNKSFVINEEIYITIVPKMFSKRPLFKCKVSKIKLNFLLFYKRFKTIYPWSCKFYQGSKSKTTFIDRIFLEFAPVG